MPHRLLSKNPLPVFVMKHHCNIDPELKQSSLEVVVVPGLTARTSALIDVVRGMIDGIPNWLWIVPYPRGRPEEDVLHDL